MYRLHILFLLLATITPLTYCWQWWLSKEEVNTCNKTKTFYPNVDSLHRTIKLGFLASNAFESYYRKIPGALSYAVEVVNKQEILPEGYQLQFKVRHTNNSENETVKDALQLVSEGVHGIIGPDVYCTAVASITHTFSLPMFSYGCREKYASQFNNYVSLTATDFQLMEAMTKVIKMSTWKSVLILYTQDYETTAQELMGLLNSSENDIDHKYMSITRLKVSHYVEYDAIVQNTRFEETLYVLLSKWTQVKYLWNSLKKVNFLSKENKSALLYGMNEDYEKIALQNYLLYHISKKAFKDLCSPDSGFDVNGKLLVVTLPPVKSSHLEQFKDKVRENNHREPFCHTSFLGLKTHVPLDTASALFDSVMLYAKAVRDVYLSRKRDVAEYDVTVDGVARDGPALIQHVTNTIYTSVLGKNNFISSTGIRRVHYELYTLANSKKCHHINSDGCSSCLVPTEYIKVY